MRLTLVATYAAVSTGAASTMLGLRGEVGAAVVVALLSLVALAVRLAWMTDWQPGRTAKRRAAAVITVMLLVSAAGGPVGTASAQGLATPICPILGVVGQLFSDSATCDSPDTEEEQTRLDLYASSRTLEATGDSFETQTGNLLTTSRSAAWTEAKIEVVNELNNGSNRSESRAAMNETIRDYYARVEYNIIQQAEKQVEFGEYISETEMNETDEVGDWVNITWGVETHEYDEFPNVNTSNTANVSLVNGSSVNVSYWRKDEPGNPGVNHVNAAYHPGVADEVGEETGFRILGSYPADDVGTESFDAIWIRAHNGEGNVTTLLNMSSYGSQIQETRDQPEQLTDNVVPYVQDVYDRYNEGELNASDLLGPTDLASRAATDYNSTGYYAFAGAELAALGLGGNLSTSVTVNRSGTLYNGSIYSTAGAGNWSVGDEINVSETPGVVYMAVQDGNESRLESWSDGTLTITDATNTQTGEDVETVTRTEYVYEETSSAENLSDDLNRTAELREELERIENQQGIGIGIGLPDLGLGGFGVPLMLVAAGYLLIGRD